MKFYDTLLFSCPLIWEQSSGSSFFLYVQAKRQAHFWGEAGAEYVSAAAVSERTAAIGNPTTRSYFRVR